VKGMLVVGFVLLSAVGFTVFIMAVRHDITRRARVRASDNKRLREQLTQANTVISTVKRKVDEIGDLNPILANAVRPLVEDYLVENGRNVK
jgi:phosphotransferase system IIB component